MQTEKYKRKPIYVEAIRVTEDNFVEVAAWCQGSIVRGDGVVSKDLSQLREVKTKFIKVRVINPQRERQTKAFVGDWVLYSDYQGYKVYTEGAFRNSFDPAPDNRSVEQAVEDARASGVSARAS
jgi:hypothetical protein